MPGNSGLVWTECQFLLAAHRSLRSLGSTVLPNFLSVVQDTRELWTFPGPDHTGKQDFTFLILEQKYDPGF